MPRTLTRAAASGQRGTLPVSLGAIGVIVTLVLQLSGTTEDGRRADLTFVNDTVWDLDVELVRNTGSRLPLARIGATRTVTVEDVLAREGIWRVRWKFAGREIHLSEVSDEDLARDGHRITVPEEVPTALRAAGAPPRPWLSGTTQQQSP